MPSRDDSARHAGGAREFLADNAIVATAQLLSKLRGIITIPLIVKTAGTAGYGVWAQVLAFSSMAVALIGFNLHLPLVRRLAETWGVASGQTRRAAAAPGGDEQARAAEQSARTYSTLLLTTLAFAALVLALSAPALPQLSALFLDDAGLGAHLSAGLAAVAARTVLQLNTSVYRATRRLLLRSGVDLVGSLVELLGIVAILVRGGSLLSALWFTAAWNGALALGTGLHVLALLGWARPDWSIFRFALGYSAPLVPVTFSVWALDRADRFFIGYHHGLSSVGAYSAAYALGSLVINFQTPMQVTVLPKVGALWDTDRETARRYVSLSNRAFLTLAIPYCAGSAVAGPVLLRLLGSAEIAESSHWLTPLVAAGSTLWGVSVMQHQMFHGAHRTGAIGWVSTASALLNVLLNVLLVPTWGPLGAAIATVVAYASGCLALYAVGGVSVQFPLFPGYLLKCFIAAAVMTVAVRAVLELPLGSDLALIAVAVTLAPAVYFPLLIKLGGFSAEERQGLRNLLRRRAAAG